MFEWLQRPLHLAVGLEVHPLSAEAVLLLGEGQPQLLEGPFFAAILRTMAQPPQALEGLLPGGDPAPGEGWSGQALVDALSRTLSPAGLLWAGQQLLERAILVEGPPDPSTSAQGLDGYAGISSLSTPWLTLLPVSDLLAPEAFSPSAHAGGAVLLVQPGGPSPWIGPLLGVLEGPCWTCLAIRLRWNQPVRGWLARRHPEGRWPLRPPLPVHPSVPLISTLEHWIKVLEPMLSGPLPLGLSPSERPLLRDHLLAWEPRQRIWEQHTCPKLPDCPVCGPLEGRGPRAYPVPRPGPIALQPRPVRPDARGGLRSEHPDMTYHRLAPHLSPLTGVISSLGPLVSGASEALSGRGEVLPARLQTCPVWGATLPTPCADPPLPDCVPDRDGFHLMTAGKGLTSSQARMSALGEALERHCALWRGTEVCRVASYSALGADALHPDVLQQFSPEQRQAGWAYPEAASQQRVGLPPQEARGLRVPPPLDPEQPLEWVPCWSLTHERTRWVPAAWCFLRHPDAPHRVPVIADSNGLAAGANREEAILQGLLELVERDAAALWWYHQARRPGVALEGALPSWVADWQETERRAGRSLHLLDLTHDLDLPVLVAVSRAGVGDSRFHLGFGAHPLAAVALERALTELAQLENVRERSLPWERFPMQNQAFLEPDPQQPLRHLGGYVLPSDLTEPLWSLIRRLEARGLEVLVADLSRPELPISVVRVIVPGLRPFWPRFRAGRLFEVPRALGWRPLACDADGLNTTPLLL